jgi:phosphate transport system protein
MIRISREFERIGDQAVNIADVSQHTDVKTNSQTFEMIHQMSKLTTMMLSQSIEILDSKNLELIPFISDREEGVDRYFHDIHHSLVSEMRDYPDQIESLANLLLVSRYLERSADHVVNVTRQIKKNEYWGESS